MFPLFPPTLATAYLYKLPVVRSLMGAFLT